MINAIKTVKTLPIANQRWPIYDKNEYPGMISNNEYPINKNEYEYPIKMNIQ